MKNVFKFLFFFIFAIDSYEEVSGSLWFPTNSAYGIFAAIAVPLDLPHRNIFVSYNFEANYNLPYTWNFPPYALEAAEEDLFDVRSLNDDKCTNCTIAESDPEDSEVETTTLLNSIEETTLNETKYEKKTRKRKSLLTRTDFYHILKDKFQRSGYNGEACLLRLICETNSSQLGHINGVLGSVMHIIFTPTTSMKENLPKSYYQAEVDGVHEQCQDYERKCKENLLDLISEPLHSIIDSMTFNK
ncbi:uncharacterized protein LOC119674627 [Teleopsis dalmanni]|uniref:uncharacterized protein LOC119674627 n=1 Tax=Teleopsis dalmanni TaxID=139649 RepID=UPI0018CCEF4D|nr:uncharacterized protein LOC119674627 [Teleopsis dalmanni]